jgi:hypothetical protein
MPTIPTPSSSALVIIYNSWEHKAYLFNSKLYTSWGVKCRTT